MRRQKRFCLRHALRTSHFWCAMGRAYGTRATQSHPWCHVQAVRAPEYMELFTVMLGFDVSLTLPMLQQVVAEGRTSSP